jgi:hypothetical protein
MKLRFGWCGGKFVMMVTVPPVEGTQEGIAHRISCTKEEMDQVVKQYLFGEDGRVITLEGHRQVG